jgi:hypothetical protein
MIITDALNGHTVEDVRRNQDGSVTLYTDHGRTLTLHVDGGRIVVKPPKLLLPDARPIEEMPSERMRLREAFLGFMVSHVTFDEQGFLNVVCAPHDRGSFVRRECGNMTLTRGHREVRITHHNGLIDELPPVSAIIALESLSVFGESM